MASPKSELWWILWIHVCPWLVHALKCSNYSLTNLWFGLCRFAWVNKLFFNLPSPILKLQHTPLPQNVASQGTCPNFLLFHCFHFRLTFESIKELGSTSSWLCGDEMKTLTVGFKNWCDLPFVQGGINGTHIAICKPFGSLS